MRRLTAALLLALAAGCASTPSSVPVDSAILQSANWTLQGRIGIQAGGQSLSGNIHWKHRTETDDVLMTSPLGQGVVRIVTNGEGVVIEVPNQPERRAPDVESLTREVLGYALPLSGLAWWVRARPDPARAFEATHDTAGRIAQLRQDGWVIDYLQYADDARPRKLVVTREGLEIRLVADSWQAE